MDEAYLAGKVLRIILKTLVLEGYQVHYSFLSAVDFGLPTIRTRIFILASLLG